MITRQSVVGVVAPGQLTLRSGTALTSGALVVAWLRPMSSSMARASASSGMETMTERH